MLPDRSKSRFRGAKLSDSFKVATDVVSRTVQGDEVLLHLGSGMYYGLNETGSLIWSNLKSGKSLEKIVEKIVESYDIPMAQAEADLLDLIAVLAKATLVEPISNVGPS